MVQVKAYRIDNPKYTSYLAVTADTCVPVTQVITGSLAAITGQKEYGPGTYTISVSYYFKETVFSVKGVLDVFNALENSIT